MVLARAKELGGTMQLSPSTSTKLRSSNAFGSTTAEWMLVKTLKAEPQRTS